MPIIPIITFILIGLIIFKITMDMKANMKGYWKTQAVFAVIAVGLFILNWVNVRFNIYPVIPSQGGYDLFLSNKWPGWVQMICAGLHIFIAIFVLPALSISRFNLHYGILILIAGFFWGNVFFFFFSRLRTNKRE